MRFAIYLDTSAPDYMLLGIGITLRPVSRPGAAPAHGAEQQDRVAATRTGSFAGPGAFPPFHTATLAWASWPAAGLPALAQVVRAQAHSGAFTTAAASNYLGSCIRSARLGSVAGHNGSRCSRNGPAPRKPPWSTVRPGADGVRAGDKATPHHLYRRAAGGGHPAVPRNDAGRDGTVAGRHAGHRPGRRG